MVKFASKNVPANDGWSRSFADVKTAKVAGDGAARKIFIAITVPSCSPRTDAYLRFAVENHDSRANQMPMKRDS